MSLQDNSAGASEGLIPAPIEYAEAAAPVPPRKRPRIWPAVLLVTIFWAFRLVARHIELTMLVRFGITMLVLAVIVLSFLGWWFISRRTSWVERIVGAGGAIAITVLGAFAAHRSLRGLWIVVIPPIVLTAWTAWWAIARDARPRVRTGGLLIVLIAVCGFFTLLRTDGLNGEQQPTYHLRWSPSYEQAYLANALLPANSISTALVANSPPLVLRADDWPGFRGPRRNSTVVGITISTDLKAHPPRQLWRQPVGPGWSSPIVVDNRVFTQEQHGNSEILVSRDVATGNTVWVHSDTARFEESMSGAGPRATPQFADGRIYSMGATGILNCLDAVHGNVLWSRNLVSDTGSKPFMWGFASSPLVSQGIVIVYVGGAKGLLGYRQETGEPAWSVNTGAQCYTSAQPAQLGGKEQVLFFSDAALVSVDPASGHLLWNHDVIAPSAPRSVQPQVISDSQVLVSSETDLGTALVDVKQVNDVWHAERGWRTRALKPSFNDFVVHDGYAYGFDGQIFCCTDLKTGKRAWREGEYGHGQVLLLADQGVLLVSSEEGEIVLLRASPQGNQELSRFQALTGKTWNHPAIARGRLFVRNGQQMACFELTPGI